MSSAKKPINIIEATRKIEVDNRIPLQYYYKIADNLLKQANVYLQENNIIDLYILLLRYAGLVAETIPLHQEYSAANHREKMSYRKKLRDVISELECLGPEVKREISKVNMEHGLKELYRQNNASSSRQTPLSRMASIWPGNNKQTGHSTLTLNIRVVTPEVVAPSAPPIENLVIDDDVSLQCGSTESRFADSSSSTTEDSLKESHDEGSSSGASSCIICYEAPIEGACVPCGHMAGCMSRLNEIKAKSWGCPVCRAKIELVLRLYAV